MPEIESVGCSECALSHGQVIDSIKEIGLTLAVITTYTIDIRREIDLLQLNITKVRNNYFFKYRPPIPLLP